MKFEREGKLSQNIDKTRQDKKTLIINENERMMVAVKKISQCMRVTYLCDHVVIHVINISISISISINRLRLIRGN